MQLHISNLVVTFTILSMGCACAAGNSSFKITTKRDSDSVEIRTENGKTVISVRSPFGISQAAIERTDKQWSTNVMLRLHLKGLENFKLTVGKVTLEAAVSTQDGNIRQWKDGKEDSPLDSKHAYWLEIRMVGKDAKPVTTIPLKDAYFEMQLPKALFEENPKSITVSWIDFYR